MSAMAECQGRGSADFQFSLAWICLEVLGGRPGWKQSGFFIPHDGWQDHRLSSFNRISTM